MASARAAHGIWSSTSRLARVARGVLTPLEVVYRGAVTCRGALYDAGILRSYAPALPTVSVGNLSVGGTGKTPVSAWLASRLACLGASPAIVLRGYGDDEPLVHAALNPEIPVVSAADRLAGVARAAEAGADIAVLDDAFQHRRIRRVADVVLVSAEGYAHTRRLLPAGPWREPAAALRRASVLVVTRKVTSFERATEIARALGRIAPDVPQAGIHLAHAQLCDAIGTDTLPLGALAGARVLAISAIGDPHAFRAQLTALGAEITTATFGDHHRFTTEEAERLAAAAEQGSYDHVVCTLKDAVKLAPLWPRQAPRLWYVSQRIGVEYGGESIDAVVAAVLEARHHQP